MIQNPRFYASPDLPDYFGNILYHLGGDGVSGTADDNTEQQIEGFITRDPKEGRLYFDLIDFNRTGDSAHIAGTLSVPSADPVFTGPILDPHKAGASVHGLKTEAVNGQVRYGHDEVTIERQTSGQLTVRTQSTAAGMVELPATTADLHQWSQRIEATLTSMTHQAGMPECAPEPLPVLSLPGFDGGESLPDALKV